MGSPGNRLQKRVNSVTPLRTVQALQLRRQAIETVLVKDTSPWNDYAKIYSLKLGVHEPVIVAQRKGGPSFDLVSIHQRRALQESQLELIRRIQHPNFTTVHEVYHEHDEWYIVTEHMTRSLQEAVGNPFLDSAQVAAIIGQIVEALVHLEDNGLRFMSLTCSDVLLHPTGMVKLRGQHNCVQSVSKEDIRRLGKVMMELMDGYVKDNGSVGLDDTQRWGPEAVHFLCATTTASSAKELLDHAFLGSWKKEKLKGLVSFVTTWTKQSYRYLGGQDENVNQRWKEDSQSW